MISVSEAQTILSNFAPRSQNETAPLDEALGRICAADIKAKVTLPPCDASAMDGYAVRLEDVRETGAKLTVIGDVPAGSAFDGRVGSGEAVRVFTGSPIPDGANHIIIQENAVRIGDALQAKTGSHSSQYIRRAGLNFSEGDVIIPHLTRLGPPEIALAAAGNHAEISVLAKPRISFFTSGDELVAPGDAAVTGDVVNSNSSALSALIKSWDGNATDRGLSKDDPVAIQDMFERAMDDDIIVPIGGASVGDHDHMRRVFRKLGGEMIFEKVAVKPGKPTWFGVLNGTPVLGLPGNPASSFVCAHLFLRGLMGRPAARDIAAHIDCALPGNGPRETYLRARMTSRKGRLYVQPFPRQDSALLTPFRDANVLLRRLPNAEPVDTGDLVTIIAIGSELGTLGFDAGTAPA